MHYSLLGLRGRRGREVGKASWVPCSRTWGSLGRLQGPGSPKPPCWRHLLLHPASILPGCSQQQPGGSRTSVPWAQQSSPRTLCFHQGQREHGDGEGVQPAHRCVHRQFPVLSLCFYVYKNKAEDTKACPASTGLGVSGFSGHLPEGPCARPAIPSRGWQDFSRKELCIHSPDPGPSTAQPCHLSGLPAFILEWGSASSGPFWHGW